jgi:hypothetical protein
MKAAIIGLPQCGATTVFNALTGAHGDTGAGHRAVVGQLAVLKVPDPRLDFLAQVFEPKKVVHATMEVEDLGGVFAHLGAPGDAGSAKAMADARMQEVLLIVLRAFQDATVPHVLGSVDAARDLLCMEEELLLADLSVVESRTHTIRAALKRSMPTKDKELLDHELALLGRCREAIESGRGVRIVEMTAEQQKMLRAYAFLTLKPRVVVLNVGEEDAGRAPEELPWAAGDSPLAEARRHGAPLLSICARLEMEIMELDEKDRAAFMADAGLKELAAGAVVHACQKALDLRTYFTYSPNEVRARTLHAGETAVDAAREVHTDLAEGFIRAEVFTVDDLKEHGSVREIKAAGRFRLEGRDYEVQDGDVIIIRHSG